MSYIKLKYIIESLNVSEKSEWFSFEYDLK